MFREMPEFYRIPEDSFSDIADAIIEDDWVRVGYFLDEIGNKQKAMELASEELEKRGRSDLAEKCLTFLLKDLKELRNADPDSIKE